jgi:hypothetical protein
MFYAFVIGSALGQGVVVIQHSGATDPLTEGFSGNSYGSGPITHDKGYDAWSTSSYTNLGSTYTYNLTSPQRSQIADSSWSFSVNVRVTNTIAIGVFYAALEMGSEGSFSLVFGSDPSGDPFVVYGPPGTNGIQPSLAVIGAGSSYNNYQLIWNPAMSTASLWVDGVERVSDVPGGSPSSVEEVLWGAGGGVGYEQANWNLVSLEIIPEPSTWSVLVLGGGLLIYLRTHRAAAV